MKKKASKRGTHIRLSGWDYTFHFLNYLLFGVFTILCIYPFYYIIINSISDGTMVDLGRVLWYPIGFTLSNYKKLLALSDIYSAALVSLAHIRRLTPLY